MSVLPTVWGMSLQLQFFLSNLELVTFRKPMPGIEKQYQIKNQNKI